MMMDSIFDHTIGKQAEDTLTEVLVYILQNPDFEKVGGNLRSILGLPSSIHLDFSTQERFNRGRFDISVKGSGYRAVIESKFEAQFTETRHGGQLQRYIKKIKDELDCDESQVTENRAELIVLCPQWRKRAIAEDLKKIEVPKRINIRQVTWESIAEGIKDGPQTIAGQVWYYINNRYNIEFKLAEKTWDILTDKKIGSLFNSTISEICQFASHLKGAIKKPLFAHNAKYEKYEFSYGSKITTRAGVLSYWFGFYPRLLAETGTICALLKFKEPSKDSGATKMKDEDFWYWRLNTNTIDQIRNELGLGDVEELDRLANILEPLEQRAKDLGMAYEGACELVQRTRDWLSFQKPKALAFGYNDDTGDFGFTIRNKKFWIGLDPEEWAKSGRSMVLRVLHASTEFAGLKRDHCDIPIIDLSGCENEMEAVKKIEHLL